MVGGNGAQGKVRGTRGGKRQGNGWGNRRGNRTAVLSHGDDSAGAMRGLAERFL